MRKHSYTVTFIFVFIACMVAPVNLFAQQMSPSEERESINNCDILILKGLENFIKASLVATLNQKCYEGMSIREDGRISYVEICPGKVNTSAYKDGIYFDVTLAILDVGKFALKINSNVSPNDQATNYIISVNELNNRPVKIFPNTRAARAEIAFFMLPFCIMK